MESAQWRAHEESDNSITAAYMIPIRHLCQGLRGRVRAIWSPSLLASVFSVVDHDIAPFFKQA